MTEPDLDLCSADSIAALITAADGIGAALQRAQAAWLLAYLAAMLDENRAVNLTAVRDPLAARVFHALDGLAIAAALPGISPARIFDVGTGNGFPGVAAAAVWPKARVVLCDRTRKKVLAIGRALTTAGPRPMTELPVTPLWADVAQLRALEPAHLGGHDLVLVRAVAEPAPVARLAEPLLAVGGRLALWLSGDTEPPERLGRRLRLDRVTAYRLPAPADRERRLGIWSR